MSKFVVYYYRFLCTKTSAPSPLAGGGGILWAPPQASQLKLYTLSNVTRRAAVWLTAYIFEI